MTRLFSTCIGRTGLRMLLFFPEGGRDDEVLGRISREECDGASNQSRNAQCRTNSRKPSFEYDYQCECYPANLFNNVKSLRNK